MPHYISMVSMSGSEPAEPGSVADAIGEGAPVTRKLVEDHGGTLHEIYLTMGAFDVLMVMEFDSTQACAQAMLAMRERLGGVTQTIEAFPESEWAEIAEGV